MSTITQEQPSQAITTLEDKIDLGTADQVIAGYKNRLSKVDAKTPAGYEAVRQGIRDLTKLRTSVESSRKALKQNALEYGRRVDAEAKRVTQLIRDIEEPLRLKKQEVDEEAERIKREEAERKAAEARAKQEAEERERREKERLERERIEAEQAAERERLAKVEAEQRAEREKLLAERRKLEAEKAAIEAEKRRAAEEAERKERERLEAEKEAERKRLQAIEDEKRLKREEEERIAAEKRAEQERIAAETRRKAEEAERQRILEERKPDSAKLRDLAAAVGRIELPSVKTEWAQALVKTTSEALQSASAHILEAIENE